MSSAKEYLERLKNLDNDITSQIELVERLRAKAESCTAVLTDEPRGNGVSDKTSLIDKRIDIENKLGERTIKLYDLIDEAERMICQLNNPNHRAVLRNYYINNKTWAETARAMHYSYTWTTKLHGFALAEFEKVIG